jgi:uncharacterized membrane protein YfcA
MDGLLLFLLSLLAGGVGALSGFGIGSLLTPFFAWRYGTKLAVAVVSIPHFFATAYRCWLLRAHIDRRVLWTFGLASSAGGLAGAFLHTVSESRALTYLFGGLLILAGAGQWTHFWDRLRFGPKTGVAAGIISGILGGLVGNQGGIRTASLFGFHVPKEAFIATGTAAALAVDIVRMPVYVASQWEGMQATLALSLISTAGTLIGTWAGTRWLRRIPEAVFKRVVAILLILLGLAMFLKPD